MKRKITKVAKADIEALVHKESSAEAIMKSVRLDTESQLRSLHDYSAGLNAGFVIPDFSKEYATALETQKLALSRVSGLREEMGIHLSRVNSILDTSVLPISGAIADIGLATASASKLFQTGEINREIYTASGQLSGVALDFVSEIQRDFFNTETFKPVLTTIEEVAPSIQAVGLGVSEMVRSLDFFPYPEVASPGIVVPEVAEEIVDDEEGIARHQELLDELLGSIDKKLVGYRRGAWEAFESKNKDYLGQASSSMRRLVDELLRSIAPHEEVKNTNFFKNSPEGKDSKENPTRKAKVMYVVGWETEKGEHLRRITNSFVALYDNLSAWDHVPLDKDRFVHGVFIALEGQLIAILSAKES